MIDDRQMSLGRLYARAMLDVAVERGEEDQLGEELNSLAAAIADVPSFAAFAGSPLVEDDSRRQVVEKVFRDRVSDLLADSLEVIAARQRLAALPAIVAAYNQELRERRGLIDAEVVTAIPLTDELRQALKQALAARSGKQAELKESVDPSILGGLVVRTGDEKIDASSAARLKALAARLSTRASEELIQGRSYTESTGSEA